MTLAESKRAFVFNEAWSFIGLMGSADSAWDSYIANVFGYPGIGSADTQYTGNQIQQPLAVLKLAVQVNWGAMYTAYDSQFRDVFVDVYLIALNEQLPSTVTPRLTSGTEDTQLFMKQPIYAGRSLGLTTLNGQSVTVIKRKRMTIRNPGDTPSRWTTHHIKISKRFRGTKTFETTFDSAGNQNYTSYLKGWNYYWLVVNAMSQSPTVLAAPNPVTIIGDRYMYFKDF